MYLYALHFSDAVLGSSTNNALVSDDSINMFLLSLECLTFCSFLTCHLYHLNGIFRTFYLGKTRLWCSSFELASVHFFVATNLVGITVTIIIIIYLENDGNKHPKVRSSNRQNNACSAKYGILQGSV